MEGGEERPEQQAPPDRVDDAPGEHQEPVDEYEAMGKGSCHEGVEISLVKKLKAFHSLVLVGLD